MKNKLNLFGNKNKEDQSDTEKDYNGRNIDSSQVSTESDNIANDELKEQEKLEEKAKVKQRTGIIRTLAGAYLVYSCYTSVIAPLREGKFDTPLHFTIIFVLFGVLGVILLIDGVRKLKK